MGFNQSKKKEGRNTDEAEINSENPFDYPFNYLGEILISKSDDIVESCSGLLISNNCVLTSASFLYEHARREETSVSPDSSHNLKLINSNAKPIEEEKDSNDVSKNTPEKKNLLSSDRGQQQNARKSEIFVKNATINRNSKMQRHISISHLDFLKEKNEEKKEVNEKEKEKEAVEIKSPFLLDQILFKPVRTQDKSCFGEIRVVDIYVPDEFLKNQKEIKYDWAIIKLEQPIGMKINFVFGREGKFLNKSILDDDLLQYQITIGYTESTVAEPHNPVKNKNALFYQSNIGSIRSVEDDYITYVLDNNPQPSQVGSPVLISSRKDFFLIGIHTNQKKLEEETETITATRITKPIMDCILKKIEEFKEKDVSKYEDTYSEKYYSFVTSLVNIGSVFETIKNYEKTLEYYEKACHLKISLLGENHISVATSYNNVGIVYKEMKKYDEASEHLEKSIKIILNLLGENHISTAKVYTNLGLVYEKLFKYEQAINSLEKALSINQALLDPADLILGDSHYNSATVYFHLAKYDNAIENYKKAMKIYRLLKHDENTLSKLYNNLANCYYATGRFKKALKYFERDIKIVISEQGEKHLSLATTYNNLGLTYKSMNNHEKAMSYFESSLEIHKHNSGEDTVESAKTLNNMGGLHFASGNYEQAIDCYERAIRIKLGILDKNHISLATNYNNIGVIYKLQGKFQKALECYNKALSLKLEVLGETHPSTLTSYNNMGEIYKAMNNEQKAQEYFAKAKPVD